MCYAEPIVSSFTYAGISFHISDDGNDFSIGIETKGDRFVITPRNTQTDAPAHLVSYLRSAVNFLLYDIEVGQHQGPLEDHTESLLEVAISLEEWTFEHHPEDGFYFQRNLVAGDEASPEVMLRTEEPEEWTTDYSTLIFTEKGCISDPQSIRTTLPSAMMRALAFAAKNTEEVFV